MKRRTSPLDNVRVAAPCSAGWENMVGTERVRFCGQCSMNVYNLSEMTKADAERLITQAEGRLCVRYYSRADGTILTRNCPVGLRALRRRVSRVAGATASAVLTFLAGVLASVGLREQRLATGAAGPVTHLEIKEMLPAEGRGTGMLIIPRETKGEIIMGTYGPPKGDWVEGQVTIKQRRH